MVDEIELHRKRPVSVEQPARRETTRRHTKRDRPAVIEGRTEASAILPTICVHM